MSKGIIGSATQKDGSINTVFVVILGLILGFSVVFKGMYFERHFLYFEATLILLVPFFVFKVAKKSLVPQGLMEYGIVALVAAYILSALVSAVNLGEAVAATARMITYVLFYLMISRSLGSLDDVRKLLGIIYISGVVTAVAGLGAYFGWWNFEGAVFGDDRLASFFQYPNTAAIFLLICFIFGLYLGESSKNTALNYLMSAGNALILIALIGTKSRIAFIVLLLVLIFYIAGQNKNSKMTSALYMLINVFPVIVLANWVLAGYLSGAFGFIKVLVIVAVAAIFTAGFSGFSTFTAKTESKTKIKTLVIAGLAVSVLLIAAVVLIYKDNNAAFSRITQISLGERTLMERGFFYSDGLEIVTDYPLLGTGGGGWQALYKKYQSYNYSTNLTHNYFLQIAIEVGLIGLTALLIIYVGLIIQLIKTLSNLEERRRKVLWATLTVFAAISIHSVLDFNMSFGSIGMSFWLFLALFRHFGEQTMEKSSETGILKKGLLKYSLVVISIIVSMVSVSSLIALEHAENAVNLRDENKFSSAKNEFMVANKFNPLRASYLAEMAQLDYSSGILTKDPKFFRDGLTEIEKALKLDKNNFIFFIIQGKLLLASSEIEKGLMSLNTARELAPWNKEIYEEIAYTNLMLGKFFISKGDERKGREYLEQVLNTPRMIQQRLSVMHPKAKALQLEQFQLEITETINGYVEEAVKI